MKRAVHLIIVGLVAAVMAADAKSTEHSQFDANQVRKHLEAMFSQEDRRIIKWNSEINLYMTGVYSPRNEYRMTRAARKFSQIIGKNIGINFGDKNKKSDNLIFLLTDDIGRAALDPVSQKFFRETGESLLEYEKRVGKWDSTNYGRVGVNEKGEIYLSVILMVNEPMLFVESDELLYETVFFKNLMVLPSAEIISPSLTNSIPPRNRDGLLPFDEALLAAIYHESIEPGAVSAQTIEKLTARILDYLSQRQMH